MSHDTRKVRTVRQHDTAEGMKAPGDVYDRAKSEAEYLAEKGIVEIISTKPAPKAKKAGEEV